MFELTWFKEPTVAPQTEDEKIDAEIFGRAKNVFVAIYENAAPDPVASEAAGRQRYKNVPFICVREEGSKDFISQPMTEFDQRRYPRAWQYWLKTQEQKRKVSVELLPGMTPAPLRELTDLGLIDIESLAAFDGDLQNLSEWRVLAKRLVSLSKPRLRLVDGKLEEVA